MFRNLLLTSITACSLALPAASQDMLGGAPESPAGEFETQDDPGRRIAVEEAVAAYARDFDLNLEEAERRLMLQMELQDTLAEIEEAAGPRIDGAWIEHEPRLRAVVRLAEGIEASAQIQTLADQSSVPIELVQAEGDAVEDLVRRLEDAMPRLQELGSGFAGGEVDVRTGEIVLFYETGEAAEVSPEARQQAQETAREILQAPLRIEETDAPVGDGHTRGGADLSTCTSGFVVRHPSSGTRGYITAGHCGNNQTYFEFGGVNYSTTFIDEIRDADQDVQWHTTPHIEEPRFYASSTSSHRPLTSRQTRSQQAVGGYVCHRGKTTGYSCGTIQTKTYAPGYSNACPGTTCSAVWIRVEGPSLECFPGDSGGSWFLVYSAYGIYKGQSSSGTDAAGCNWAFYMASNYFGIDLVYD
jgi:streptogrisin C